MLLLLPLGYISNRSLEEPTCGRIVCLHDYFHMELHLSVTNLMLKVGEGGCSVELALPEAILEKEGNPNGQVLFRYNGHLQRLNRRG